MKSEPKIPYGFRKVEVGETILQGDLMKDNSFSGNEWRPRNSSVGHKLKIKNLFTIRPLPIVAAGEQLLEEKPIENKKWTFFRYGANPIYTFVAANEMGGYIFNKQGQSIREDMRTTWNINSWYKSQIISQRAALNLIPLNSRQSVCKLLGIVQEKIEITSAQKDRIINNLQKSRAFNQDSALALSSKHKDMELLFQLAEENQIKEYEGRFYVEKTDKTY